MPDEQPRPQPGDARPPALAQAPGERYRPRSSVPAPLERPGLVRGIGLGLLAGLAVAAVSALLRSILDYGVGLLVVAGAGGWLVGAAIRFGAWSGRPHRASRTPELLAALLGLFTWVAGLLGAWLVAMAILPGSSRTFLDRVADTPFLDWVAPQLGVLNVVELLLLVGLAWYGARSAPVEAGR